MAEGIRISQLPQLLTAEIDQNDELPIVDVSDSATKRITKSALLAAPFDPIDVNGGTIDGTTIGATSASTGAFTTLTASTSLNVGSSTTVTGVLDEDNMVSDSDTKLATQQSIKAYVDSQVATADTLSEVLALGNTTGGTNLVVSSGDTITTNTIGETTIGSGVTVDGVLLQDGGITLTTDLPVTDGGTGASTAAAARSNLDVDQAGTDNSTNVTLTGTPDYITIDEPTQVITVGSVDLAADVTGTLPLTNGGTGATTAAGARTSLNVDVAGTDNSTNVTLAGVPDYLTLSGQQITLNSIDLTTDVTGALPVANGGTGATTAAAARTALDVDQAGTDNSTNVTLAGAYDYLTLSGQQITLDQVDLATDVSGALPTANLTVVNSNTGSFGNSTTIPVITVNDKGLITAVTTATVSGGGTVDLTTDVTGILPIANGGTNATSASAAATNLGLGTGDSPSFAGLTVDTSTLYVDSTNNRVGVGTASPESKVHIYESDVRAPAADADDLVIEKTGDTGLSILSTTTGRIYFGDAAGDDQGSIRYVHSDDSMRFETGSSEAARFNASRHFLVGKTATASVALDVPGHTLYASGTARHIVSGGEVMNVIRQTSDGNIIGIYKDATHVAAIGVLFNDNPYFSGAQSGHCGITFEGAEIVPMSAVNRTDNYVDIGNSTYRYDDIYATNGTIQTSDANEKQQIASLTDAEITAAKAISKLFKTFKWNDKVEAKGDAARTHTGVIAQEVEQAMTDAGLDAGNYAFFISSTWWETQTEVPAVEAVDEVVDEDGNVVTEAVEAQEAYTRTDTYKTIEEAPEGATERTRLGIRYPELLAFIGAATEQRLTSIEARLATLENA